MSIGQQIDKEMWYIFHINYSVIRNINTQKQSSQPMCKYRKDYALYMILLNTNSQKKKKKRKAKLPSQGFPGGKESSCQFLRCRRHGFNSWVRKIPWRRKERLTPVFLPGKFHGQRSLGGYSPWGHKQSNMTEGLSARTQTHTPTLVCQQGWGGAGATGSSTLEGEFTCRGNELWGMMIMFIF